MEMTKICNKENSFFEYKEDDGWCWLDIKGVGGILTTKDKLENAIYATFIVSLMDASVNKGTKKIEEILKSYKVISEVFL